MLLFATNVLWKTTTGGQQWAIISPDLSREHPEIPESVGDFRTPDLEKMPRRGVIYARRTVAERRQGHLGGHRRWARARDARWREDVDRTSRRRR